MPILRQLTLPRRAVLACVVVSFLGWSSFELLRPPTHPLMDLSDWYADQTAHMNAARLFTRYGPEIWKQSTEHLARRPTPQEYATYSDDIRRCDKLCKSCLFSVPGWTKPVLVSWWHVVRFYPPGDLVLTAPVAALYQFTSLSLIDANRLLLISFLLFAHLGMWLLLDSLVQLPLTTGAAFLPAYLAVNAMTHWTMEGFYDSSIVFPLLLCWRFLGQRRGLAAIVTYCVAAFIHFRSYYYAPWVIAAAVLVIRERQWRTWRIVDWIGVAIAGALGGASLVVFHWITPGLMAEDKFLSPMLISSTHLLVPVLVVSAVVFAVAATGFVLSRGWMDLAVLSWIYLMLTQVHQSFPWYEVSLVPWLVSPPRIGRPERTPLLYGARLVVFIYLALFVHQGGNQMWDTLAPTWLQMLWR